MARRGSNIDVHGEPVPGRGRPSPSAAVRSPSSELTGSAGQRYPGGKNAPGTWQWLLDHVPPHAHYVEPFVGSGAVLRRKSPSLSTVVIDRDRTVAAWWRRLAMPGVSVVHGCGIEWLGRHADELCPDTLVYCDPPYPLTTRTKQRLYSHELTEAQHLVLLGCLLSLRCQVMVSSYWSPEYSTALRAWHCSRRDVITRGGTLCTEHLWCNFVPPGSTAAAAGIAAPVGGTRLQPAKWPGRNYRERERIKRKVQRWREQFRVLPRHERRCLLEVLIAEEQRLEPRQG